MKRLTLTLVLLILSGLASSSLYAEDIIHPNTVDKWPNSRYAVDADKGTVIDKLKGLMWQRCAYGKTGTACSSGTATEYSWVQALGLPAAAANRAALGGHTDWRLPNIKELATLNALNRSDTYINTTAFPGQETLDYWSSTPSVQDNSKSWVMNFRVVGSYTDEFTKSNSVRLVRDAD